MACFESKVSRGGGLGSSGGHVGRAPGARDGTICFLPRDHRSGQYHVSGLDPGSRGRPRGRATGGGFQNWGRETKVTFLPGLCRHCDCHGWSRYSDGRPEFVSFDREGGVRGRPWRF
ncbi:hypothetical protein ACLB2K_007294 [Fragaria x ananassa]